MPRRISTSFSTRLLLVAVLAVLFSLPFSGVRAAVSLPHFFGDNMVLQRDMAVPCWGTAAPGEAVTVAFAGQEKSVIADAAGKWRVTLDPLSANKTPQTLTVSGTNKLSFTNVLVGEVWLCSGQSNMEFVVEKTANSDAEKAAANFPSIRHFKVPRTMSSFPRADLPGSWEVCSPQTVGGFTAVGYFFARELFEKLDVPVGLLHTSWGGTPIDLWVDPQTVAATPEWSELQAKLQAASPASPEGLARHKQYLEELKKWTGQAEIALAEGRPLTEPPDVPWLNGLNPQPTQLHHAMIRPFIPYAIRGVLWYQGESNGFEGTLYAAKLRALIRGWRSAWQQGDFPFYIVQLANYRKIEPKSDSPEKDWTKVREAQLKALSLTNTGLAVTIDIGDSGDVHPKNKQDVGKRLALWALDGPYGKNLEPSGPIYKSSRVEGGKMRISFDHAKDGLMVGVKSGLDPVKPDPASALKWIQVAGEDRVFKSANAVIEDGELVVSSPEVPAPVAVRYAFIQDPEGANLYNKEGLPASPFRTDSW
jgi:sialate O-acetylesterase